MAKKVIPHGKKKRTLPELALLFGILVFTFLLYLKSLSGQFLDYDDTANVVNNPVIRGFTMDNISHLFSGVYLYMYTPVTFLSFALDYVISGPDPFYFKLTNLLLHMANTALLFVLARRLFKEDRKSTRLNSSH